MTTGLIFLASCIAALGALCFFALRGIDQLRLWVPALLILTAPLEVYRVSVGPMNVSLFRMAIAIGAVVTVVEILRTRPMTLAIPIVFVPYAVLVGLQIISLAFVTPAHSIGQKFLFEYVAGLAAASMVVWFSRDADARTLVSIFVLSALLPAAASIWRTIFTSPGHQRSLPGLSLLPLAPVLAATRDAGSYLESGVKRMEGTFGDPNHFGFFLGLVLVVCLTWSLLEARRRAPRLWLTVALTEGVGIVTVLLVGSYSRSAWLLVAIGIAVLSVLAGKNRWRRLLTPRRAAVVAGFAAVAAALLLPIVLSRLNPSNAGTMASNRVHAKTAKLALDLFVSHPVTGVGLGAYGRYAHEPYPISAAHSTILTTAAELGGPGVVALLAAMLTTAVLAVRSVRRQRRNPAQLLLAALTAGYVALAAANLVYDVWTDDFQWAFFGITVALTAPPVIKLRPLPKPLLRRRRIASQMSAAVPASPSITEIRGQ